jgi:hypothetical protein
MKSFRAAPSALAVLITLLLSVASLPAVDASQLLGRWDLTVKDGALEYPSWLEIQKSGYRTLVGSYVGRFGSARPVSRIDLDTNSGSFRFVIPPQWERSTNDIVVEGKLEGTTLRGVVTNDEGKKAEWTGVRAPALLAKENSKWGKEVKLFNGKNLDGWKPRDPSGQNGWKVENGLLMNAKPGNDLLTTEKFGDFKIRAKFRYPKGSNSGLYLRGRYEVQIEDNYGKPADSHYIGGVYGFLTPRTNASKPAGEWQTMEITLVGRFVTVVLNGETIIERQAIPGITGGALDSREGEPGPLMIQGDHGPVEFQEILITPARD